MMRKSIWLWITLPWLAGCSVFGVNTVEEASYQVESAEDDFEIREYAAVMTVETTVEGSWDDAGGEAFQRLFRYISGNNEAAREIAMTAPVIGDQQTSEGQKISMTAPVLGQSDGELLRYRFVLPASFTPESAPVPLDESVRLVAEPPKRMAVVEFSGLLDEQDIAEQTNRLSAWLVEKGLTPVSAPQWAGYNPPWTLPFLRRNEIMIEIE